MLLEIEESQKILPSTRDNALFRCGVLREIPPSLLSLERVLDTLEATQEVHHNSRLHSRGTLRVPPHFKKSPGFPSSTREEGPFPCFVRKGIPAFLSHIKRRRSPVETQEDLQGRTTIPEDPSVPIHSRYTRFPCTDSTVTLRIDSKHDGRCDSPVAPQEKATDPYVTSTGSLTPF